MTAHQAFLCQLHPGAQPKPGAPPSPAHAKTVSTAAAAAAACLKAVGLGGRSSVKVMIESASLPPSMEVSPCKPVSPEMR